jgi:hypothetical protein
MDAQQRPLWVRLMVTESIDRQKAFFQISFFCLIGSLGWIAGSVGAYGESILANIAFGLGLVCGTISLLYAIWIRLAIRWVDRHGKWAGSTGKP